MAVHGKKLGILISVPEGHPNFQHGLRVAQAALAKGVRVYLYCIDEAVTALENSQLQELKAQGANLFACAYAAQRRNITLSDKAIFAGLTVVNDLISNTDRFVSFN